MKKLIFYTTSFLMFSFVLGEQKQNSEIFSDIEKVKNRLEVLNLFYTNHPNYEVKMKHLVFSSYTSKIPEENYSGYFKYKRNHEHSNIIGVETIQNDEWRIALDSNTKTIVATLPKKQEVLSSEFLGNALKMCTSATLYDSGYVSYIDLYFNPDIYPMSHLKLIILKNRIQSIDIWHAGISVYEESTKTYPHTRIEYSLYRENPRYRGTEFETNHILKKSGSNLLPVGKYRSFKIYDLRLQK